MSLTFSFLFHRPHEDESGLFRSVRVDAVLLSSPPATRRRKRTVPLWSCRWRSLFLFTDHTTTKEDSSILFVSPSFSCLLQRPHEDERRQFRSGRVADVFLSSSATSRRQKESLFRFVCVVIVLLSSSVDRTTTKEACSVLFVSPAFSFHSSAAIRR